MGSSAKKKREKKQDFQKTKLKVGKARPKNTNATDTSFAAKSIVLKQQSLTETERDAATLMDLNLSLLSSRNDSQRRDALTTLTTMVASKDGNLPRPVSTILAKSQPLVLDGSSSVRQQLLKLLKSLPHDGLGSLDQTLLYTRAGMTHLSADIRSTSLDVLDWLLETNGEAVVNCAGGWVKMLQTFQNLLSWRSTNVTHSNLDGQWSTTKPTNTKVGTDKLLVHQLSTLANFLSAGLKRPILDTNAQAAYAAASFPIWHMRNHLITTRSSPYNHLNLFGTPREVDNEVYDDVEDRADIFHMLDLAAIFGCGVKDAKSLGGEVGRAAASVDKALQFASLGRVS
jgi:pre-rRNA-processing protein IPI1